MPENIDKNKLEQFKKDLILEEGFFTGNLKDYRKVYHLLDDFLQKNADLREKDSSLFQEVNDLLIKLKWYSFPYLTFKEVVELFQNNIDVVLKDKSYPLSDNLRILFLTIPLLEERDIYKKQLRDALKLNQEKITDQSIVVGNENLAPSITNWLRNYDSSLGAGTTDRLKLAEFLVKNRDISQLGLEAKEKIKRLFNLYVELLLSSQTPEGIEEEEYQRIGDKLVLMRGTGVQETIRLSPTPESRPAESLISKPPSVPEIPTEIKKEITEEEINKEVESLKEKMPILPAAEAISYDQAVKNIIDRTGLNFSDEAQESRFKNIATSFLKDIRGEIETRLVLKRPQNIGGMEYDEAKADEIIKILKEQKPLLRQDFRGQARIGGSKPGLAEGLATPAEIAGMPEPEELPIEPETMPVPLPPTVKDKIEERPAEVLKFETGPLAPPIKEEAPLEEPTVGLDEISKNAEELAKAETPPASAIPEITLEEAPAAETPIEPSIADISKTLPAEAPPSTEIKVETSAPIISPEPDIKIYRPPTEPLKPPVEEIKVTPKIYGPVDELRTLTLKDWQHFGSAKEALNRILDKINLLAEESLLKKLKAFAPGRTLKFITYI